MAWIEPVVGYGSALRAIEEALKLAKGGKEPHVYVMPKTTAELGIVCKCGAPCIWFDYEIGERNHMQGFMCAAHKVSDRVEKLAA